MDLNDRKLQILQAVIAEFINTGEPVGSRSLSRSHDMGISPATIRNEMSDLEEMGYLTHPHTSAGRIPSDKAYRLYVDELMNESELPEEEKQAISHKLSETKSELDSTIEHAADLLSQMTNLTSFAIAPRANESKLKYINLLPVDETTVVLMIVPETGKVMNKALKVSPYTEDSLELLGKVMTHNYMGKTLNAVLAMDIINDFTTDMESLSGLAKDVVPSFIKTLEKMLDVDLYMNGYSNIFNLPEYSGNMEKTQNFFRMLEDKNRLTDVIVNRESGVVVTIGDENSEDMKDCSLITADYKVNGKLVGKLGVIGPKRMKYDEVTSVIKYISENISDTFEIKEEK